MNAQVIAEKEAFDERVPILNPDPLMRGLRVGVYLVYIPRADAHARSNRKLGEHKINSIAA
jgi:hypothetical protein